MDLQTERSRNFFVDNGYKFVFDKASKPDDTITFWRCERKNKDRCPARIHVQNDQVTKRINEHNHESDPAGIEVTRIRNAIKQRAVNTQEVSNSF